MARQDRRKIDVAPRQAAPLLSGAFSALDALDSSLLAPSPEPPPVAPPSPKAVEEKNTPAPVKKVESPGAVLVRNLPEGPANSRGRLVLRRETKGRGGKTVVVIDGFRELPGFSAVAIADLSRTIRQKLGCGGSFDRQEIVIQGDRPEDVTIILRHLGFRVEGVTFRP